MRAAETRSGRPWPQARRLGRRGALLVLAALLAACAGRAPRPPADDAPTLKTLAQRPLPPAPAAAERRIAATEADGIRAWQAFLDAAPRAPQRAEAMRRLGDLEMDRIDRRQAEGAALQPADHRAAIARYEAVLAAYPRDPGNDRVLYQLARAHEQAGALEAALAVLDRLVAEHPATAYREEVQFRRGETLFTLRQYARAEQAFAAVLPASAPVAGGTPAPGTPPQAGAFHERALYMRGWSQFKQGRLDEALGSFLGVLDGRLGGRGTEPLEQLPGLTRADRELVEDTLRVTSLSLAALDGARSIPPHIDRPLRQGYAFRLYEQLAELYLRQERIQDAAETLGRFAALQPLHDQAPLMQARVIDIHARAGFAGRALQAKEDYVTRYGPGSAFRQANPAGWQRAQPLVRTHLDELARHHHARAQQTRAAADVDTAVQWYRRALLAAGDAAPGAADASPEAAALAAQQAFLLGELLAENARWEEAVPVYEQSAYNHPLHARSADAGYAALLARQRLVPAAAGAAEPRRAAIDAADPRRAAVDAALRFAAAFDTDARTPAVLTDAAERLFALGEAARADALAAQVLQRQPAVEPALRRVAWTLRAHAAFDRGDAAAAEAGYAEVLALLPAGDPARRGWSERLAASMYRQGERAREAGDARAAAGHFERAAQAAPEAEVGVVALFDAAVAHAGLKEWDAAARGFEAVAARHPRHALARQVPLRLSAVYLAQQQWALAAAQLEAVAAGPAEADVVRGARWEAAQLYARAGQRAAAERAYERYLQQHPQPLEPAVEARWRLATMAREDGRAAALQQWARAAFEADRDGGEARTGRTRTIAALASLDLAAPAVEAYRSVRLVEPLQRQLRLKKARLEAVLQAYAPAAGSGVAEAVTAATFHTAALYHDFGKALMASERPRGLRKAEREQYDVMLEEQAFPFEEKAAELHMLNAARAADGLWDAWIARSYAALAELRPARYGKTERSAGSTDLAEVEQAMAQARARGGEADATLHNRHGVALRRAGRLAEAAQAYARATALAPTDATPWLNLAVLQDLYLGQPAQALESFARHQALAGTPDPQVDKWIAELKTRRAPRPVATATEPRR